MTIQDTAASAKIEFLDKNHPWLAGYCEAANDWGAALSIGVGGATVFKDGLSVQSLLIFLALGLAAVLGTATGWYLTNAH